MKICTRCPKACDVIETQFPDVTDEQLKPLIDFLAELLAAERIQELEENERRERK